MTSRARNAREQRVESAVQRRAVQAARSGVDWWVMRLATSPHLKDSLSEIQQWSWADQVHAHKTLDALDDMAAIARHEREEV